jgi:hypothetical protein
MALASIAQKATAEKTRIMIAHVDGSGTPVVMNGQ